MNFLVINMEALTLGSIVLPNIIFMLYFIQQGRTAVVALPVIFFYVMAKTVPYAIRSFGNVKNPYRILLTSSCLALGGVGLAFFKPLLPEGATPLGIGMGCLKPAYQQLKDEYHQQGTWHYSRASLVGIFYLLIILGLGMWLSYFTLAAFMGELFLMIVLGIILVIKLPTPWPGTSAFSGPFNWRPVIATLIIFGIAMGARGLKQTGSLPLTFLTLGMWIIMLMGFGQLQSRFKSSRLWTFWTSATTNFLLIYSLFYFDTLNLTPQLFLAYGLFILATIGGLLLSPRLRNRACWRIIFPGAAVGLLFSLFPSNWCFLAGLFITSLCCSSINALTWPFYQNDSTIPPLNNRFIRQHFNILGTVISQITLISLLIITNFLFNDHGRQLLHAYYAHTPNHALGEPLWLTRVICVALLVFMMVFLINRQSLDNDHS